MATITPTMSTTDINKYLKKYKKITFSTGVYNLTAALVVYSGCTITCKPNVVFNRRHRDYMVKFFADKNTTEYNGCHDTTWKGGRFIADTDPSNCNIINLVHCKNITLDSIIMEGCIGYHTIELNSSCDVIIKNCSISRQKPKADETDTFREGIQIDFAFKGGVGVVGGAEMTDKCYDATHCKNITISNCKFDNCPDGIGTHTIYEKNIFHENITITNCTFTNIGKWGIKLLGMKNVTIKNCNTTIVVNKKKQAHKLPEGKVTLKNYKCCDNIIIDNIKVS